MREFLIRVLINAVAIAVTAMLIPNIHIANNDVTTLLAIGLIFGLVNSLLKPLLLLLTCPAVLLSLGLFIFVINGVMLMITDSLAGDRLTIDGGIFTAILGGMVMAAVSIALETVLKLKDSPERAGPEVIVYSDSRKQK
ncbi:MAG: phage holin family protein [Chloroflexota bacterium]|nr:phage holin family protein [Chloroflexota bacterium]MDE2855309.1 phage holin family protein [Chloroflexota bacterium]MDE2948217.1 phage holin family protein [Chloroflexota bacterium]